MEINRGDIWFVDLNPVIGHEQAGRRPALVISDDLFNHSAAEMVIILPITSKYKGLPSHILIDCLNVKSYIKTEDIRSVSIKRFIKRICKVDNEILEMVEDRLKLLLGLKH